MILILLWLHLALIAMGIGMSFSNLVNLRLSAGKTGEMAQGLALQRRVVARIGDAVIAGIWLTGLALMWAVVPVLSGWLAAKLGVVVLLTLSHALARRTGAEMARAKNTALLPRLQAFIAGVWLCALVALALALLAFAR